MLRIYDQNSQELYNNSILHLNKVSVGLNGNRTIVIESSSNFTVTSPNENVKLAKLINQDKVSLELSRDYNVQNRFTPVYLNLYSEEEFESIVDLYVTNIDGDSITIKVKTVFEDNSDRLMVLLNNNGVRISDLWYKAIKSSDLNEISCIVLNQKRREFLLDLLTLTGCISSYDNLFAALDFFEWSDIVTVKEYWKDGQFGKYRITDVNNKIIDRKLLNDGFVKTNWLGLYFQLNQPDGTYDSDGFANFEDVNVTVEDLWTKLYYLKQILEETFLPTNVKIIDIVGEHTSIAGLDKTVWVDKTVVTDIEPNPSDIFDEFDIIANSKDHIIIEDSYCLRKLPIYIDLNDDMIKLDPNAISSQPNEPIFKIIKTKEELSQMTDFKDYEVMTQFYRGDFASIEVVFNVINEDLAGLMNYKIALQEDIDDSGQFNQIYLSELMSYSELLASQKLGIRKVGKFRLVIYVFNGWGAMDMVSSTLEFTVSIDSLNIQLYEISDKIDKDLKYDIGFYTTIPTVNQELVVPDAFDPIFDISDRSTAFPGRYFKNSMTERYLETTINQYNMVENRQLQKCRIIDYSTYHEVLLFSFDDTETSLKLKLYDRHEWSEVSNPSSNHSERTELVSKLNDISFRSTDWKNPFNRYTYHLTEYSVDGSLTNTIPVIVAFAKEADNFFENMVLIGNALSEPIEKAYLRLLSLQHAVFRIDKLINPATSDLTIIQDKVTTVIENVTINDLDELVTVLKNAPISKMSLTVSPNGMLIVSSDKDIVLKHDSIGTVYDIVRNVAYDNLKFAKIGQDFQVTIPVFATPEKRYNTYDYVWEVIDRYSGDVVHTENNRVMSWLPFDLGVYDIKLSMLDVLTGNSVISAFKKGGIRISDRPFTETSSNVMFYNTEQTKTVYNTTCLLGTNPEPLIYKVRERKYSSTVSQEDANMKALREIEQNAQDWANAYGYCRVM
ncbi:gp21 [Sphingomonas phage PAU]|uniref:gp21 n=1 Tax=Sphingomonas phage PAU TaxID=1150991 RepID=UPI000257311A|nr:gp21 [Sphingomonas phage PAU]AFF28019.1 gp21 [Sphingomonas phage PAU]